MKEIEKVLGNLRSIERLIREGHLAVNAKDATVTMTVTLFSQIGRTSDGKPNREGFIHFVEYLRAYINFMRGYRIGADGKVIAEGDTSGLLLNEEMVRGYVVKDAPPHDLVMVFSHANGKLEGPEEVK